MELVATPNSWLPPPWMLSITRVAFWLRQMRTWLAGVPEDCELRFLPVPSSDNGTCSGRGTPIPVQGYCDCWVGYQGPACEECTLGYLSSNGLCVRSWNSFQGRNVPNNATKPKVPILMLQASIDKHFFGASQACRASVSCVTGRPISFLDQQHCALQAPSPRNKSRTIKAAIMTWCSDAATFLRAACHDWHVCHAVRLQRLPPCRLLGPRWHWGCPLASSAWPCCSPAAPRSWSSAAAA